MTRIEVNLTTKPWLLYTESLVVESPHVTTLSDAGDYSITDSVRP